MLSIFDRTRPAASVYVRATSDSPVDLTFQATSAPGASLSTWNRPPVNVISTPVSGPPVSLRTLTVTYGFRTHLTEATPAPRVTESRAAAAVRCHTLNRTRGSLRAGPREGRGRLTATLSLKVHS